LTGKTGLGQLCNVHTTWNVALHGRATILYFDKLIFGFPLNETGCMQVGAAFAKQASLVALAVS
jgi:hypothetical protein